MKYLQVRIPMMEVIPLRHAEKGSTLEFDAFSRDGKLIAEEGTQLTDELLERFDNFNVRKVVVTSPREQWIPADERNTLSSNAEVLQEKEFSEAAEEILQDIQGTDSMEKMRKTALYLRRQASRAGDEEGAQYLDDLIARTEKLEGEIDELTERLKEVEDEAAREEIMDALEGKVRQLEEAFMEVAAPDSILKDTLNVVNEREDIRSSLTDFVHENLDIVNQSIEASDGPDDGPEAMELEGVDDRIAPAIKHFNVGESVEGVEYLLEEARRNEGRVSHEVKDELEELHEQLAGQRETIERFKELLSEEVDDLEARKMLVDVLEGRRTVDRQTLMELPISRSFASKTYELVEERMESHHRVWDCLESLNEEETLAEDLDRSQFLDRSIRRPPEEDDEDASRGPSLAEGDLVEVFETVEDGTLSDALNQLEQAVSESDEFGSSKEAEVSMAREKLADLENREETLIERVEGEVDDPDERETLKAYITGEKSFQPEKLMSMDADVTLLESIGDFVTEKHSKHQDVWQTFDDVSGGAIRNGDDGQSEVFQDRKESVASQLKVNERASRSWDEDGTSDSDGIESDGRSDGGDQPLLEVVENGDEYDVANRTGLEMSTVKAADTLLEDPEEMDGDQQILFEPMSRAMKKIFYGRKAEEDALRDATKSLSAELEAENRPYNLIMEPPDGEEYVLTHGLNTTLVTVLLGQYFDLSESEMLDVAAASLVSDLGMVTIPPALWLKDDSLTQRGEQEVKQHPEKSDDIVSDAFNGDEVIGDLAGQHHERVDGSGYPHFRDKEEQHPLAPIVAAADAYTAMIEPRPHRGGQAPNQALVSMLKSSGEYDRSVVKGLVEKVGIYPNGSIALLDDARLALVANQNPEHPLLPSVMLLTDQDRNRLGDPRPLDLSQDSAPSIKKLVRY